MVTNFISRFELWLPFHATEIRNFLFNTQIQQDLENIDRGSFTNFNKVISIMIIIFVQGGLEV